MKTTTKLWIGLGVLAVLTPLGIIIPTRLKAGAAWGEWTADQVQTMIGYIPCGMDRLSGFCHMPLQGYLSHSLFTYILSAVIGIAIVALCSLLIGNLLIKKEHGKKK